MIIELSIGTHTAQKTRLHLMQKIHSFVIIALFS